MSPRALAVSLLAAAAGCAHAPFDARSDPALLLGCWRGQEQRQVFNDGRQVVVAYGCTMAFGATEFRTRCPPPRDVTIADFLNALPQPAPAQGASKSETIALDKEQVRELVAKALRLQTYEYRVDRPGHYVATLTERKAAPKPARPREARYRVEDDRLEIAVDDPPARAVTPGLLRLETVLFRAAPAVDGSECLPSPAR